MGDGFDSEQSGPRRLPTLTDVLVFVAALAASAPVVLRPTCFIEDDAFFYLVIARHIVEGDGSTFNGLVPTNGYHPAWMLVCTALVGGFGEGAVVAAVIVSVALFGLGIVGFVRLLSALGVGEVGAAAGCLLLAWCASGGVVSEMALAGAVQVAALAMALTAREGEDSRRAVGLGVLLGAMFLARLDTVFVAGAAWAAFAARRPRSGALVVVAGIVTVAPYLAWNLARFGHAVPISGALKSSFPIPDLVDLPAKLGPNGMVALVGGVAALALARRAGRASALLGVLGAGTLAHVAYVALFTRHGWITSWPWYYTTGHLAAAASVSVLLDHLRRALPPERWPAGRLGLGIGPSLAATALGANLLAAYVAPEVSGAAEEPREDVRMARELDRRLPADAVVAVFDLPGILAWYGRRDVLAMDGLTSDFATADLVASRGFAEVMRKHGVTCFLGPTAALRNGWYSTEVTDGRVSIQVRSWRDADTLVYDLADARLRGPPMADWGALWDGPAGICLPEGL